MKTQTGFVIAAVMAMQGNNLQAAENLERDGAFGFPQKAAKVLCDRADLKFSVWNNDEYLFAQAVLWNDGDDSLGKTEDNREIGDNSSLLLDLDADGKPT